MSQTDFDSDSKDQLGDRMKGYEREHLIHLDPTKATILRLDGKSFTTFTRAFNKPFDSRLSAAMALTTKYLMEEIPYVKMGYTQSDEISLYLPPQATPVSEPWFGGKLQKMVSVSAGLASARFNQLIQVTHQGNLAVFDCRVCQMDEEEVPNYFIWRQLDCHRNAINGQARLYYSTKELQNKSQEQRLEMIKAKGGKPEDYPSAYWQGQPVIRSPSKPRLNFVSISFIADRTLLVSFLTPEKSNDANSESDQPQSPA